VLALAAERAVERILGVAAANFAHSILRIREGSTHLNTTAYETPR